MTGLVVGALGVVYGDIGTSPLYALRECFYGPHGIVPSRANVLGVLSLIFWSLIMVVSVKYLTLVMRADNRGEGGILALMSLAFPNRSGSRIAGKPRSLWDWGSSGLRSCTGRNDYASDHGVERGGRLEVATPFFKPFIVPIAVVILIVLFSFQRHGTGRVGKVFGPVTFVFFVTIAPLGLRYIIRSPEVLTAFNPYCAYRFFEMNGRQGFVVLGSVFLVVTGGEALYADMGHFGRRPIRLAWFGVVFPALILNYLGQGGLLLVDPTRMKTRFTAWRRPGPFTRWCCSRQPLR